MIDQDDFDIWRSLPVTQHFHKYLIRKAEEAEGNWWRASWEQGVLAPELLADLRATAKVLRTMTELEAKDMEPDDEQERNTPD